MQPKDIRPTNHRLHTALLMFDVNRGFTIADHDRLLRGPRPITREQRGVKPRQERKK